jgi:hypothetical protein
MSIFYKQPAWDYTQCRCANNGDLCAYCADHQDARCAACASLIHTGNVVAEVEGERLHMACYEAARDEACEGVN